MITIIYMCFTKLINSSCDFTSEFTIMIKVLLVFIFEGDSLLEDFQMM